MLHGSGSPSDALGKNGDIYLDVDSFDFYINNNGVWQFVNNLASSVYGHEGTDGLEFYPLNDSECAVAVGTAKYLDEIVIPSTYKNYSVTTILDNAFEGCTNLKKITIPNSVATIGSYAFSGCSNLTEVNIPDGVTIINSYTFYRCSSLSSIKIPEGVKTIGVRAFDGCSKLTSITIPSSVTTIGTGAFDNSGLTTAYFRDNQNWYMGGSDWPVNNGSDAAGLLTDTFVSVTWTKKA